jgi:hypothetical protein
LITQVKKAKVKGGKRIVEKEEEEKEKVSRKD